MRKFFTFLFLFPLLAFAQDPVVTDTDHLHPMFFIRLLFEMVQTGQWPQVGWVLLILLVLGFRFFGQMIHDKIPDDNPLDKPFWFLLETKPGMWLFNTLAAVASGLGTAYIAVGPSAVGWSLVKPILTAAAFSAGAWTIIMQLVSMWTKKTVPNTVAAAKAGAAAAAKPPAAGLGR